MIKFGGLFLIPGSEICALLKSAEEISYYDKQGLGFIIKEKQDQGLDSSVEEMALQQIEKASYMKL